MISLLTASGIVFTVIWIGLSDIDGSLRFRTHGTGPDSLFKVFFNNAEETESLTRVFDDNSLEFHGYTHFAGLQEAGDGSGDYIVTLKKE